MFGLPWTFYPALLATLLSIGGWSYVSKKEHDPKRPVPLSYLFIASRRTIIYSRTILWTCGTLFAITLYVLVVPHIRDSAFVGIIWTIAFICEMAVGVFHARNKTETLHNVFAFTMGFCFVLLALSFAVGLHGSYAIIESIITGVMAVLGSLGVRYYKTKFLFYELPLVWLSHISIVVAAFALR